MTSLNLSLAECDAIERATLAAVAPETLVERRGWLLPTDAGSIGRAHSATPLHEAATTPEMLDDIEAHYRAAGLACKFRVSDQPRFAPLTRALQARGYQTSRPTLVQVVQVRDLLRLSAQTGENPVSVDAQPDEAWCQLFLGPGFDPVDGASRVRSLRRSESNIYASLKEAGLTCAGGAGSFGHGWASVHGLRTEATQRRRGYGAQVLNALAGVAAERGYTRCFLQVEANNQAQSLYQRMGFQTAWSYVYWVKS